MPDTDRLQRLRAQSVLTGIDFIYVHENQVTLDVHFLTDVVPFVGEDLTDQARIYSHTGEGVAVEGAAWENQVLRLRVDKPGGFPLYRLHLDDGRVDPYFNDVSFSFKANCPSDLDCAPPPHECPPEEVIDFPIDYRARFWSLRRALLDFASQRYPDWQDRIEADAGVMLVEVMSALGDELAYYQDRIAREAYLETATQRRSLRRHARLVDYTVHDGLAATTWLDVQVISGAVSVSAGKDIWASSDRSERIRYEVGSGLKEASAKVSYNVYKDRNVFWPHRWDEDDLCLPLGATELYIKGHHETHLPLDDEIEGSPVGRWVLLQVLPINPALPERRRMVRLIRVEDTHDPVYSEDITRLVWEDEQALPFSMDLTALEVHGNMVPCTAGITMERLFVIGADPDDVRDTSGHRLPTEEQAKLTRAVERVGTDGSKAYLFSLPESDETALTWLPNLTSKRNMGRRVSPRSARPEIRLVAAEFDGTDWVELGQPWIWRRSLVGTNSSQSNDRHFTLDDGFWDRVVGYQRIGQEIVHVDYVTGTGSTVRFGDGEFGLIPPKPTLFKVTYRLGNGRRTNVPADSITHFEPLVDVESITNPFPVMSGQDPETPLEVRQLAPDAFRAITYRAVRPEDYAEAAERLPWVQRAGATFRWTGSWLTSFTTPDPLGAAVVSKTQRKKLRRQIDRFRQAGREAYIADPHYADLDLVITVCVAPYAYPSEVKEAVLEALSGSRSLQPRPGFFSPNNFTFGSSLNRAMLEATIQAVPGVRAVEGMTIGRRGWFEERAFTELTYEVGMNEVIRVENDPLHPERGSLRLIMEGGA